MVACSSWGVLVAYEAAAPVDVELRAVASEPEPDIAPEAAGDGK